MYITEINNDCVKDTFNWTTYFGDQSGEEILKQVDLFCTHCVVQHGHREQFVCFGHVLFLW